MQTHPMRLSPGDDLRGALEDALRGFGVQAAFVLQGIGSLSVAQLRFVTNGSIERRYRHRYTQRRRRGRDHTLVLFRRRAQGVIDVDQLQFEVEFACGPGQRPS